MAGADYLLNVQSDILSDLNTRVIVPLLPSSSAVSKNSQQGKSIMTNNYIAGLNNLNHAEEVRNFLDSLSLHERTLFADLLKWVLSLNETSRLERKIVKGYSDQAGGFNSMPILLFAELGKKGNALPNSWRIRLPLGRLGIILPFSKKSDHIDGALININKTSQNFSPKDIADFISQPSKYTKMH